MHIGVAWIVDVSVIGFGDARKVPARLAGGLRARVATGGAASDAADSGRTHYCPPKGCKPAPAASNPSVEREVQAQVEADPPKGMPEPEAEQQAMVEPIPEPAAESASEPQPATEPGMAESTDGGTRRTPPRRAPPRGRVPRPRPPALRSNGPHRHS